jgi:hypothetical protein
MRKTLNLNERAINVATMDLVMQCLHPALAPDERKLAAELSQSPIATKMRLMSSAAHKLVAGAPPEVVFASLRGEVHSVNDNDLLVLIEKASSVARRVRRRRRDIKAGGRENLDSWKDRTSGWEIFSQPFGFEEKEDEQGEYVEIMLLKSRGRIYESDKRTARLHGLVAYMLDHEYNMEHPEDGFPEIRIHLVVKCMHSADFYSEWMDDPLEVSNLLEQVREALRRLEAAAAAKAEHNRVPPRTTGPLCYRCPLSGACRQGDRWRRQQEEAREARRRLQGEPGQPRGGGRYLPGERRGNQTETPRDWSDTRRTA